MKTFSHKMMIAVMITYFIGVIGGGIAVFLMGASLDAWLAYIGSVAAVGVAFYSWKAKAENVIKLNKPQIEKLKEVDNDNFTG